MGLFSCNVRAKDLVFLSLSLAQLQVCVETILPVASLWSSQTLINNELPDLVKIKELQLLVATPGYQDHRIIKGGKTTRSYNVFS